MQNDIDGRRPKLLKPFSLESIREQRGTLLAVAPSELQPSSAQHRIQEESPAVRKGSFPAAPVGFSGSLVHVRVFIFKLCQDSFVSLFDSRDGIRRIYMGSSYWTPLHSCERATACTKHSKAFWTPPPALTSVAPNEAKRQFLVAAEEQKRFRQKWEGNQQPLWSHHAGNEVCEAQGNCQSSQFSDWEEGVSLAKGGGACAREPHPHLQPCSPTRAGREAAAVSPAAFLDIPASGRPPGEAGRGPFPFGTGGAPARETGRGQKGQMAEWRKGTSQKS